MMSNIINIKKGLDLPISGAAERCITDARHIATYAVKPTDFVGMVPRLLVAEGDSVKAGDALFCDKKDERIRFTSPVDGTVKSVLRGDKRLLLAVVVEKGTDTKTLRDVPTTDVKEAMLQTGLWTMLRQRPFGTVANPDNTPKAIVVSCFDSAPLAPDYDFVMKGYEDDLCHGLDALASLTAGELHVSFRPDQRLAHAVEQMSRSACKNIRIHYIAGPHPAGNVGTQIAQFCPINKGDIVWTMNPQDVAVLGHLMRTGEYRPEKTVAVAGPHIKNPHYYRIVAGACVEGIAQSQTLNPDYPQMVTPQPMAGSRIISGNVLSGTQIAPNGFVGGYDSLISILPEGDYYDFMGWLMPGMRKYSFSRTFWSGFVPSWLHGIFHELPQCLSLKFDTNTHGEVRPLVFTGSFERVFPFDIYPLQLIKACIIGDIELQENLGIYEVEPEDFALCEFIDTSKTDLQPIIRQALEILRKEAM